MEETLGSTNTSTKRQWIAEQARKHPERVFTSLHHLIDIDWMLEAYRRTRKDGATGIDGVTATDYEMDLRANLEDLLERIKSGRYFAPPVRRHYIPKASGGKRPLGIPTFEDKVAQRAIVMILEPIYETDFLPCSYGFRPGRSAHDALDALRNGIMEQRLRWVIDADLARYFDSIPHSHLRDFLDLRIKDGVIRRMLDKWLKAGVLDKGVLQRSETGTPQGGVISPLLSSIFLHHVLDKWFEVEVRPRLRGQCQLVRYADDAVMTFADEQDGRRVLAILGRQCYRGISTKYLDSYLRWFHLIGMVGRASPRACLAAAISSPCIHFGNWHCRRTGWQAGPRHPGSAHIGRFGLTLNKTKTRYVDFRPRLGRGHDRNATFDFLGFHHVWTRSRKGNPVVRQFTARDRLARAIKSVHRWCKSHRHEPLAIQHEHLARVVRGHCNYYGRIGNSARLSWFRFRVTHCWRWSLSRRSSKGYVNWDQMNVLLQRFPLPLARIRSEDTSPA